MTHDIKTGEGNITVMVPYVYLVGPLTNRISATTRDLFPNCSEIWAFNFYTQVGAMSAFFPDDQAGALMERARLVEAMNKMKPMHDASNALEIIRAEMDSLRNTEEEKK
jgi:hypothetical protein